MIDEQLLSSQPTIRILILGADGSIQLRTIPHTLDELQKRVGGYIEMFILREPLHSRGIRGLCNEEGKLQPGLRPNFCASTLGAYGEVIVGDVLILGSEGEDFTSLNRADIRLLHVLLVRDN